VTERTKNRIGVAIVVTIVFAICGGIIALVAFAAQDEYNANIAREKQHHECYEACWPRVKQSCFWSDGKLWAACATEDEPEVVEVQHE
jgi:hypothetical protein